MRTGFRVVSATISRLTKFMNLRHTLIKLLHIKFHNKFGAYDFTYRRSEHITPTFTPEPFKRNKNV
jgi:hypothetical protein